METFPIFGIMNPIIAMIHVPALPGTPDYSGNMKAIIEKVTEETKVYTHAGVDIICLENMHDVPYLKGHVGPEVVAAMTRVACEIRNLTDIPLGIQILAGANKEALAVAHAAGLQFIRAEGYVFGHLADEGFFESCAGELLRYRKMIGAEEVLIFTDIKKKHSSHAITSDVSIVETANAADFFKSNGVIVTGDATGKEADIEELKSVKKSVHIPVIVGSGITNDNVEKYFPFCEGMIVGSYFKKVGKWNNELDIKRVEAFMKKVHLLRKP